MKEDQFNLDKDGLIKVTQLCRTRATGPVDGKPEKDDCHTTHSRYKDGFIGM